MTTILPTSACVAASSHIGELRTGLSQALATDLEDDSYHLVWLDQLSGEQQARDIVTLRRLLQAEQDPLRPRFAVRKLTTGARAWADRGLGVYGSDAARPEAVADLEKRFSYAEGKLAAPVAPRKERTSRPQPRSLVTADRVVEALACAECGATFQRAVTRGRKPRRCPKCRDGTEQLTGAS